MAAAVQKQLAIAVHIAFIENDDKLWRLNELLRKGRNPRYTRRQAVSFRIVFAEIRAAFFVKRVGPRLQRNLSKVGETETGIPDSGKVHIPLWRARRRSHGRLLIAQTTGTRRTGLSKSVERNRQHHAHQKEDKFIVSH